MEAATGLPLVNGCTNSVYPFLVEVEGIEPPPLEPNSNVTTATPNSFLVDVRRLELRSYRLIIETCYVRWG